MAQTKRHAALSESRATNQAVAIYARVSTEDQAERATIKSQLDFLRRFVDLNELPVAGEYVDDGISGTVPLAGRPEGQRLIVDAEAGQFGVVLVYRIDRLGRSLRSLLDAHDALDGLGVAIKSATEPFDTSSPIGSFLFQLLASLAELEKSTIAERTSLGRNRIAGDGQYTGGSVPFGYALDDSNRLIPSQRLVPGLEITEADLVRDIFARIASGEATMNSECARLTALGVPRGRRYGGKDARVVERVASWGTSSLGTILHNPTYKGEGRVKSRYGTVQCASPALVDGESWDRAQEVLLRNRNLAMKNAKHVYLLRGLIRCQHCGHAYTGSAGKDGRRYRCGESYGRASGGLHGRCIAKMLRADWLEDAVWHECRRFILNPGEALDEARAKLREQMTKATGFEARRREALEKLAAKETERERALTLYRRGLTSLDETEAQLEAISREAGVLREMLEAQRAQAALIDAHESFLTESTTLLVRLRDELAEIEATNDLTRKRQVIEQYVRQITVETREVAPRKKHADVRIFLRLEPAPIAVENATSSRSGWQ